MIYSRQFVVLLFSIATFSQLSPTIAVSSTCSQVLPSGDVSEYVNSQCNGIMNCTVDLSSWSTKGDPNFASTCSSAGGEVYDIDTVLECFSDGVRNITTLNNVIECWSNDCTADSVKALYDLNFFTLPSEACHFRFNVSGPTSAPKSGGPMMLGFSTTLFVAMSASLLIFFHGF